VNNHSPVNPPALPNLSDTELHGSLITTFSYLPDYVPCSISVTNTWHTWLSAWQFLNQSLP